MSRHKAVINNVDVSRKKSIYRYKDHQDRIRTNLSSVDPSSKNLLQRRDNPAIWYQPCHPAQNLSARGYVCQFNNKMSNFVPKPTSKSRGTNTELIGVITIQSHWCNQQMVQLSHPTAATRLKWRAETVWHTIFELLQSWNKESHVLYLRNCNTSIWEKIRWQWNGLVQWDNPVWAQISKDSTAAQIS